MCDHAVVVTYLPQSADVTVVALRWLVRADAIEGRDYDLVKLCWLWDETTRQDKSLIELNAAGVASRGYTPGPYSRLESMTADFIDRYLQLMTESV
jgi:Rieske 2Fe-2S family protein